MMFIFNFLILSIIALLIFGVIQIVFEKIMKRANISEIDYMEL